MLIYPEGEFGMNKQAYDATNNKKMLIIPEVIL